MPNFIRGEIMMENDNLKTNKIQTLVDVSLDKIRSLIDVNCVVGDPIVMPDKSFVIPVSKVSVGFVSGGGEYQDLSTKRTDSEMPMAGGAGGGFTVTPIGFFVLEKNQYKLIRADRSTAYSNLLKNATEVLKKFAEKVNEKN